MSRTGNGAGYGTFWIDMAEAFSNGKLEEFIIECPDNKSAVQLRFEFYAFRNDAKETYPELAVLRASIISTKDGYNLQFSHRDRSETSQLLETALKRHGVLPNELD